MSVTLRQKEPVQDTCERVAPDSGTAVRIFYDRLFEMNPQLRSLFPTEKGKMEEQGRKLMQMITMAVRELDRLDETGPAVEDLVVGPSLTAYTTGTITAWVHRSYTLEQGLGEETGLRSTLCWPV